jgi:SHS2 domain-containing protein
MMKNKIEIINHTADIGIKVRGKTFEELFINSVNGLYKIIGVKYNGEGGLIELNFEADEIEDLLVKFLNEIIYYVETKKLGGKIEKIEIKKNENGYTLNVKMITKKIKSIEKEVKSATYHNLKVEKVENEYITTIIFDL